MTSTTSSTRAGGAAGAPRSAPGVRLAAVVRLLAACLRAALRGLLRHKAADPTGSGRVGRRPGEQVVGRPGVHDVVGVDREAGCLVAPVRLPLELTWRMRVGV